MHSIQIRQWLTNNDPGLNRKNNLPLSSSSVLSPSVLAPKIQETPDNQLSKKHAKPIQADHRC